MSKIHKYELNEKKIVLDVNSGSVHVIDEIVWDILDYYQEKDENDIVGILSEKHKKEGIKNAISEIRELINNDLLFSKEEDEIKGYQGGEVIKAMCLHVAHDCNLRCEYCFASQGDFEGDRLLMSLETGKKALDFLVEKSGNRKNLEVDFFGGEPLMNFNVVKDLVEYGEKLEKIHNKNFRFTITTNGVLLNDEIMDYINQKMDNVVLSLDGRKEINDKMRPTKTKEGSYDIIEPKYLELIKLRGDKSYYVRGTFTKNNLDFSKDVLYLRKRGFDSVSVEPVVAKPEESYAIGKEDLGKVLEEYENLSREYLKLKKKGDRFEFFHFMIDLDQGPCFIKRASGCGAGVEYVAVTPEGDLYPCHQFVGDENFKLGNISTGIEKTDKVSEFREANVYTKEDCSDCWAKFYCSGGCHANAYNFNKDLKKPYSVECEMEKKRIECAISVNANLLD